MLEGRAAIHRTLPRQEKGTNRNLVKLSKSSTKSCSWNGTTLGSNPEGKDLGGKGREATAAEVSC